MIGEKGVGIKFVIFSSSKFELISHHADGSFRLTVDGARGWLDGVDGNEIVFQTTPIDNPDDEIGVRIELTVADSANRGRSNEEVLGLLALR